MGGPSVATRLFSIHAAWRRLSVGAGWIRENRHTPCRWLFSAACAADVERAAILYGRRPLDRVPSGGDAARSARARAPLSGFPGPGAELHSRVHLRGGKGEANLNGVIVVDKAEGWTSHDVVNKMRSLANTKRVGHLGTLDPIATGALPLVIGRATRLAPFYARRDKVYEAVIRFGFSTDTYDRAGFPTSPQGAPTLDAGTLEPHLQRFRGKFLQTPPPVSAKKVGGKPAYE